MRISKSLKRLKRKSPGVTTLHLEKEKPNIAVCGKCGAKLNRPIEIKKLSKTKRRSERPFPELCSKCMREFFKEKVRS